MILPLLDRFFFTRGASTSGMTGVLVIAYRKIILRIPTNRAMSAYTDVLTLNFPVSPKMGGDCCDCDCDCDCDGGWGFDCDFGLGGMDVSLVVLVVVEGGSLGGSLESVMILV